MAYLSRKNFGVVASTSSLGSGISEKLRSNSSLLFPQPCSSALMGMLHSFVHVTSCGPFGFVGTSLFQLTKINVRGLGRAGAHRLARHFPRMTTSASAFLAELLGPGMRSARIYEH